MNAIVQHVPQAQSFGSALIPQNMEQAIRLAQAMASAKLVPTHLQNDTGSCLMVVEQAMRWNMSPFAVAQCTSVIQGKLMYEGKLVAAAVSSVGAIIGEFDYQYKGDPLKPDTLSVVVSAKRASDGEVKTLELAWKDAKTKNEIWLKQPEQQLCYAGCRVWARRWTPGPMMGVYAPEEFNRETAFTGTTLDARPEPVVAAPTTAEPPRAAAAAMPRPERVYAPEEPDLDPERPGTSRDDQAKLDAWLVLFGAAQTTDAVRKLETGMRYQAAMQHAPAAIVDALRAMCARAYIRVQPQPKAEPTAAPPVENAPENAPEMAGAGAGADDGWPS